MPDGMSRCVSNHVNHARQAQPDLQDFIEVGFAHVVFDVAEIHVNTSVRAGPVGGVDSLRHPALKCGCFPITRAFDVAMFDRVVVDVVEVPFEIVFVLEGMFPESRLPDTASAFAATSVTDVFFDAARQ